MSYSGRGILERRRKCRYVPAMTAQKTDRSFGSEGYPRPQLRRKHWLSLNGRWRFTYDDELRYRIPDDVLRWPLEIEVPFAPESRASGIHDTTFHRVCW